MNDPDRHPLLFAVLGIGGGIAITLLAIWISSLL